jgi:polyferredoxin
MRWICLALLLAAAWVDYAAAQDLLARPEIPGHETPTTLFPEPRATGLEYLDAALLAAALSTASYLALARRSRRGLFLLTVASLAYFGFWRQGCVCSIGSIQNVALGAFDPSYTVSAAIVAFFALPLLFTLFFGRTFCAAVCPLGAIQELVTLRPVKVPAWADHALSLLAYVYLGAAVLFAATGTAFVICRYDPFVGLFRLSGSVNMLVLGGCFLLAGIFVGRPYCRYLCPYGAILGLLSKVSKWHLRIPPEECINCRLCEDACPYGAIREPTVSQSTAARSSGRTRLAMLLALLPILIAAGVGLGRLSAVPMARLHAEVRLAEEVHAEQVELQETGEIAEESDATKAFRETGRRPEELYAEAVGLQRRFAWAGLWLGGWVGLVIGVKLIHLSVRRRRSDYSPDRGGCVSCGRCFWYCPCEQVRLGLIENVETAIQRRQDDATPAEERTPE